MPDSKKNKDSSNQEDHRLTEGEVKKVSEHFNKHIGDRECHICGHRHWHPLPSVYTPVVFDRVKNCHKQNKLLPMVIVACHKCGATTSFLTSQVGISHLKESADSKKKEE